MEKLARFCYLAIIIAIAYYMLPIILPFLFAIVVAVLFEPIIVWLSTKTKLNRMVASVAVITSFFIFLCSIIYLSVSKLAKEIYGVVIMLPNYVDTLITKNEKIRNYYIDLPVETKEYINQSMNDLITRAGGFITDFAPNVLSMVGKFPTYFIASIVFLVATYIISLELPRLKPAFLRYFEAGKSQKKVEIALDKMKNATVGFLRAQIVLSVMTFVLVYIGLWILGFEYKITMSLVVVAVDLLPIFGTGMVLVPWGIYLVATGDIFQGIGLFILFVFITIFRRAAESKIISDSIGINPLMTLVSLYIGYELIGLIGMIIGPTILIVLKALEDARLLRIRIKI